MNNLKNRVQLIGNIGGDVETKMLTNGNKVARFSIATNENYKNASGEKIQETQWHQLVAWGKKADIAEKLLKKGVETAIEGKLVSRSYIDKDNIKRLVTEIVVNEIVILNSKSFINN